MKHTQGDNPMIELRAISEDNFRECLLLRASVENEDFVDPVTYSLAEAWVYYQDTDPVIEKVAHLTFGKGIALLSKFHVSFKALLKLLCVPVFLDQFIATVKLRTWFIISFCHLQYLNQIISFRYAWVCFLSSQKESHKYISILNRIGKTKALLYPELLRSNMFHLYRSRDSAGREFPLQILNTELYRL